MPESPDFDAISTRLIGLPDVLIQADARAAVIAELTAIWNARGAAGITKLESELASMMGAKASGPYVKNLDHAIRTLDL